MLDFLRKLLGLKDEPPEYRIVENPSAGSGRRFKVEVKYGWGLWHDPAPVDSWHSTYEAAEKWASAHAGGGRIHPLGRWDAQEEPKPETSRGAFKG